MAAKIISHLNNLIITIEQSIGRILGHGFPPGTVGAFAHDFDGSTFFPQQTYKSEKSFSLRDLIGDGFLYAVPKTRRPIEKRWTRKFGNPDQHYKMLRPKTNLVMCTNCGHDHEITTLCANCLSKVIKETKEMQEVIKKTLGIAPIEKDVIVVYENETKDKPEEFWKSQRIVEMPKKRPAWFHGNLTQSTTQQPSDSKEIKPTNLA